jgi:beta-xylosidase
MRFLFALFFLVSFLTTAQSQKLLSAEDINIRDPFIYADPKTKNYYMYASMENRINRKEHEESNRGVKAYTSKDLKSWEEAKEVLLLPEDFPSRLMVWAPEMHEYKGKYYMFVTLTSKDMLTGLKAPEGQKNWPPFYKRGTHVFVADSPLGPFRPFNEKPHTPEKWMALDGTFYAENGKPYMIFCHEWVEINDGTMDYVELKKDLSGPVGEPKLMFRASDAKWGKEGIGRVTDGCFMYKTKKGKLLMIWSSFGEKGYAVGIAESESGKIKGPWKQQDELLFQENGGHGMIFKSFDGRLLLSLHQPNSPGGKERLKLFEIEDVGDSLRLK